MIVSREIACCGVRELSGLSGHRSAAAAIRAFIANASYTPDHIQKGVVYPPRFRFAVFSQASQPMGKQASYGERFATYLTKMKLGEVTETATHVNPNSGNNLKVWVWAVDHDAMIEWMKKDRTRAAKTVGGRVVLNGG